MDSMDLMMIREHQKDLRKEVERDRIARNARKANRKSVIHRIISPRFSHQEYSHKDRKGA